MPIEALQDDRLSPTEFRVLIGLLSYANADGRLMFVKRKTLAERCRVHLSQVTRATAALAKYGWLQKSGNGGKSRPASYQLSNPFTCAESAQVSASNVRGIVTKTCAESCHQTCDDSAQGKEQTFELKSELRESTPPKLLIALKARVRKLTDPDIDRFSREIGIKARPAETYWEFRKRLADNVLPAVERQRLWEMHRVLDELEKRHAKCV